MKRIVYSIFLLLCLGSLNGFAAASKNGILHTIAVLKYGDRLPENYLLEEVWIDPALDLPGSREKLSAALNPFLFRSIEKNDLDAIELTIVRYYESYHRPIVSAVVPPQDLSSGTLQVIVVEPKVGNVNVTGNDWTSSQRIRDNTGMIEGAQLNSYNLQRDLAWLNRSPFRQTDVVLSPGTQPGTTDIELVTKERIPVRPYAGADNTGTPYLHHTRLYAGFNVGNLWGQDHQLSFQWTTALSPEDLTAFSGQYMIPLPWYHQLQFYGGYSKFKGDLPEQAMSQKGESWQASCRYQMPIAPIFGKMLHQVAVGFDFKRTNSELLFGGLPFTNGFADTNQFYFGYMLDYASVDIKGSMIAEVFAAPFHITHDQNNKAYGKLRPFAKSEYVYGRLRCSLSSQLLHRLLVRFVAAGQWTAWNLLPSEQFPLGGYETVRGYEERAFNADSGVMSSLEFVINRLGFVKKDSLELLGFIDSGWGNLHEPFFGQKKSQWLLGIGPGMRYNYSTNLVLRGDIGFPLHKAGIGRHGTHYYGGATISY